MREFGEDDDQQALHIHIHAHIDGDEGIELHREIPIPPSYDAADVRALTVRAIEDGAFSLTDREFNRAPTRQALIAYVARVRAVQAILDGPDGIVPLRLQLKAALALSNDDITAQWGEAPE